MRYVSYSNDEKNIVEFDNAAINMRTMWSVEQLVLEECVRLFQENEASNNPQSMGEFPKSAIVVFNTEGNADGEGYDNWDFIEEIWKLENGECKAIGVPKEGIPRVHSPLSKAFYPVGDMSGKYEEVSKVFKGMGIEVDRI